MSWRQVAILRMSEVLPVSPSVFKIIALSHSPIERHDAVRWHLRHEVAMTYYHII